MADYQFYTDTYLGGSIPAEEFPRLAQRAGEQLAQYKRMYAVKEPAEGNENKAVCAMADALYYFETLQNGGMVASSSIGSVSSSFQTGAVDLSPKAQAKELYRCACQYLEIYRGNRSC